MFWQDVSSISTKKRFWIHRSIAVWQFTNVRKRYIIVRVQSMCCCERRSKRDPRAVCLWMMRGAAPDAAREMRYTDAGRACGRHVTKPRMVQYWEWSNWGWFNFEDTRFWSFERENDFILHGFSNQIEKTAGYGVLLRLSAENSRIQRLKEIGIVESELNTEEGKM